MLALANILYRPPSVLTIKVFLVLVILYIMFSVLKRIDWKNI